jgi:NADH-quinone oxidoreductase subunit L
MFAIEHSYLIPLLPLLGAAVAGFLGARWLKGQSHWPIWVAVGASAVISLTLLFGMLARQHGDHPLTPTPERSAAAPAHDPAVMGPSATPPAPVEEYQPPAPYVKLSSATGTAAGHSAYKLSASVDFWEWIRAGNFRATFGFFFDPLTAVMLCVVCGIGFWITVFAAGYMKGEKGYFRFFAYLGLFIFAMTILVMGNNFLMLYLGWEGVGLCSYLLIGYYYDKPAAREAAKKAFLVNRVGDFGFGLGIMLIYVIFGSVSYFGDSFSPGVLTMASSQAFIDSLPAWKQHAVGWIPFLLMIGAFGKSAQFPLYVWLPDAMEGPTPVSALIHAATMVTSGIYMIARCSTLFVTNDAAMLTVAVVGAFTAIFAASIALRQFDLKKVFAYSTVSQLGFMFVGIGALAPVAGMFHLVTHAFFKALLFLSSGVVMHAMLGHLDMRKMSGLKHQLPKTRVLMFIGCCALAGVIPFSGFFSKDEIVVAALEQHKLLGAVMMITALMTAYYTFRLYFRVFEGPEVVPAEPAEGHHGRDDHGHADEHAHASASAVQTGTAAESGVDRHLASDAHQKAVGHDDHGHGHHNHEPLVMILPLVILAIGAVFGGLLNVPGHQLAHFLGESPSFNYGYRSAYFHQLKREGLADLPDGAPLPEGTHFNVNPDMWGQPRGNLHPPSHGPIVVASILIALLGVLLAYVMHLKDRPRGDALPAKFPGLTRLLEGKYWVDEIYQKAIVEPLRGLGRGFFWVDRIIVDGVVWAVSFVPQLAGFSLKLSTQRGSLQGYAVVMLLSVAAILLIMFLA